MTEPLILHPASRSEWLQMRTRDITGTEAAALYGASPYMTPYELWHLKKSQEVLEIEDNERMRWGRRLEAAIAQGCAEDMGLEVQPMAGKYFRREAERMGATLDFHFKSDSLGSGPLEIKNVDFWVGSKSWDFTGEGEAPPHIEIQVQHQLAVTGDAVAILAPLFGGNNQKVIVRHRDDEFIAMHIKKVAEFWASIEANTPPAPDYVLDADFITKVVARVAADGKVIDASTDEYVLARLQAYKASKDVAKKADEEADAIKAELLLHFGDASKVVAGPYSVSCGNVADTPPTIVTPDMVGKSIGGRSGYRSFRVTKKKDA